MYYSRSLATYPLKKKKKLNILPNLTYLNFLFMSYSLLKERESARLEHMICSAPNPSKDTQRQGKDEAIYPPFMVNSLFLGKR